MSRHPITWLVCLGAVAVALAGAIWWVSGPRAGSPTGPPVDASLSGQAFAPARVDAPPRSSPAIDVLRAWDAARARAYASGDVSALRALYVDGSAAGATDERMLRAFTRRGLTVQGMRMQLLAVEVLAHSATWWRLRVTDRLHGAVAVGASGSRMPLPRDEASTRTVTLRLRRGAWHVAAVTR